MNDTINKKISVVIPAAGQGRRMQAGINKQYLSLKGKPILSYTLDAFEKHPLISEINLVINSSEKKLCENEILFHGKYKKIKLAEGGASRQASVFSGLKNCSSDTDMVLIHDGARPMITRQMINKCIQETLIHKATVVAVPVKNTIKFVGKKGYIDYTPDRSMLYEIQTPQSFDFQLILKAYEKALKDGFTGSDDASLVERLKYPVKIIKGQYSNIKITTPEDLIIAESIIALQI